MPYEISVKYDGKPFHGPFTTVLFTGHLAGFVAIVADGFYSKPLLEGKGKPVTGFRGIR